MKLKLKGRRFDTNEEIQAETQKVLDTLTEKDFQEAFQKWRRRWDQCPHAGGNYEGHLESKERFAIKKYLLIIGKKKNMQVLSHTFTYFST